MVQLHGPADHGRARALVEEEGLAFDVAFDELVGVHDRGELVAVGARLGEVLKMVSPALLGRSSSRTT